MGCTLSFCHFTNSESEAPRSWVARRGLPHSCGWPMSTRARLGRSCPETAPAAPDRPPPRAGVLFLFLCISPFAEVPSCFRGTPACALGLTRVPLRDGCVFLLSSHTFNPLSPLSALRTRRSLPFGRTQAALARQARCLLISPLPRTAAIFAHGRPRTCDHAVATCLASHALLGTWGPVPTPPPRELLLPKKPVTAIG